MAYRYAHPATSLNGIMIWLNNFLGNESFNEKFKTYKDINNHLKQIRLNQEPDKKPSNDIEKNAIYIQKNYKFSVVKNYFKTQLKN